MTEKPSWNFRYAPHIGLAAPDLPLFLHSAGTADPVAQIDYLASLGFAGIEDNSLKVRPVETQVKMGEALARNGMQMGCFVNNPTAWDKADLGLDHRRGAMTSGTATSTRRSKPPSASGGKYVTVVSGRDVAIPLGYQIAVMIDNLKRTAPRSEQSMG